MPDIEYVTRPEFNNMENRVTRYIHDNMDKINKNSESITRLETLYQALEGLPGAIAKLDKTLIIMSENMNAMGDKIADANKNVDNLRKAAEQRDETIRKLDSKSKIDWQVGITNNFWKIISALLSAGIMIKFIVDRFGG